MKNEIKDLIISVASKAGVAKERFGESRHEACNGTEVCCFYIEGSHTNPLLGSFDKCIFSKADNGEAAHLMLSWIDDCNSRESDRDSKDEFSCNWDLNLEFARLVLEREVT